MDADQILNRIGGWRKYQCISFILLGFVYMRGAWPVLAILFMGADPGHKCTLPTNNADNQTGGIYNDGTCEISVEVDGANVTDSCIYGFSYGNSFDATIVSDFDLVCGKDYMVDLGSTIYMIGNAIGAVVITPLSDRYGRKWVMLICLWLQGVIGTGAAFSNSFVVFTALRFFIGFLNMAIALICYVMIAELFPSSKRTRPSIGVSLGWSLGILFLALFGYLLPNWRHLELMISLPNFLTIAYTWLLSESVSWLVSQHKLKQLKTVLRRICKMNGQNWTPVSLISAESFDGVKESKHSITSSNPESYQSETTLTSSGMTIAQNSTIVDLFKTPKMRRYTVIMFYLWFVNSLGYFGILFSTPALHGNIYVNVAISGAVEIPAILICMYVLERVGRRKPLVVFMLLCGVMNIVTLFIPTETASGQSLVPLITTLAMIGKFGISGSYSTSYLMSAEIFPTVIRNQAIGLSSFFENLGSITAPFIVYGAKSFAKMPLVLFGVLTLIGGLLALCLPETHNVALPETIEDVECGKQRTQNSQHSLSTRL